MANIPSLPSGNKNRALLEFVNAEKPATDNLNGRLIFTDFSILNSRLINK